jgi:cobalamin-dependent methionine synthase I
MSSKIEVALLAAIDAHREALKPLGLPLGDRLEKAVEELKALLAAPVVERQPVAIVTGSSVQWLPGAGSVKDRAELYAATPELAELQATVARLTAENERLARVEHQSREALQVANQNTKQVIADRPMHRVRLKGGQGEPIYQVMYRGDGGGGWCDADKESFDMKVPHPKHWKVRIVYTSQPAPVSVVLDEGVEFEKWWCRTPVLRKGKLQIAQEAWEARACLDKVKELNG